MTSPRYRPMPLRDRAQQGDDYESDCFHCCYYSVDNLLFVACVLDAVAAPRAPEHYFIDCKGTKKILRCTIFVEENFST